MEAGAGAWWHPGLTVSFSIAAHKEVQSRQVQEHRSAVVDFVEDYLKSTACPLPGQMWPFPAAETPQCLIIANDPSA